MGGGNYFKTRYQAVRRRILTPLLVAICLLCVLSSVVFSAWSLWQFRNERELLQRSELEIIASVYQDRYDALCQYSKSILYDTQVDTLSTVTHYEKNAGYPGVSDLQQYIISYGSIQNIYVVNKYSDNILVVNAYSYSVEDRDGFFDRETAGLALQNAPGRFSLKPRLQRFRTAETPVLSLICSNGYANRGGAHFALVLNMKLSWVDDLFSDFPAGRERPVLLDGEGRVLNSCSYPLFSTPALPANGNYLITAPTANGARVLSAASRGGLGAGAYLAPLLFGLGSLLFLGLALAAARRSSGPLRALVSRSIEYERIKPREMDLKKTLLLRELLVGSHRRDPEAVTALTARMAEAGLPFTPESPLLLMDLRISSFARWRADLSQEECGALIHGVENVACELARRRWPCESCTHFHRGEVELLLCPPESLPGREELDSLAREITAAVKEALDLTLNAVYTHESADIFGLARLRSQLHAEAESLLFSAGPVILDAADSSARQEVRYDLLFREMEKCESLILSGDREQAIRCLEGIFAEERNAAPAWALLTDVYLEKIISDAPADLREELAERTRYLPALADFPSAGEMMAWLRETVDGICSLISASQPEEADDIVERVDDFLARNYAREGIGVPLIAREFEFSPNYLSHIYKKRTGRNLGEQIAAVRIENACRMLIDGDAPVVEVAKLCGFSGHVNYFYQVFKRLVGVTPSQYREQHREAAEE